jgi:transposase-like protein
MNARPPDMTAGAARVAAAGTGEEISVSAIARRSGVDRTFLYRHRDLLAQVHASEALPSARPAAGAAVTRASLQADLLAVHERSARLAARIRQLEHRLSDALGEQVWRESGLGQPDDIGQLKQQVTHLAEENQQLRGGLAERDQDLAAARAASRELMAASIRAADGRCGATYIRCGHSGLANRSAPSTSRLLSALPCPSSCARGRRGVQQPHRLDHQPHRMTRRQPLPHIRRRAGLDRHGLPVGALAGSS